MKRRILHIIFVYIPLGFFALTVLWVLILKWMPVVRTPLMDIRAREFRTDDDFKTRYHWVSLEEISPNLAMAVMASEDTRFLEHDGFDRVEIQRAIQERKAGKRVRGASTISQQTAKNVFLPHSKTYVRKAFEAYFTVLIEWIWGKERIMEVYLNVIEVGKGVYGAEAAAREFFGCSAAKLSTYQASMIAASLPRPLKRCPARPSSYMNSRSGEIRSLMYKIPRPDWL